MNQIEPNKKIEDKGVSGAKRPRVGKHVPYVQRGKHGANVMKHAVPAKRGETRNVHDLFTIGVTS